MVDHESVSELTHHLGYKMRQVSNAVSQAFAQQLARFDVTVAEWVVLRALFGVEGPVAPSVLADQIGLTRGAISKLVDRLTQKGLVRVVQDPIDRRYQLVHLSSEGRDRVPALAHVADANDLRFFDALSGRDRATLGRLLDQLIRHHQLGLHPID